VHERGLYSDAGAAMTPGIDPAATGGIIRHGAHLYAAYPTRRSAQDLIDLNCRSRRAHQPWVYVPTDIAGYQRYLDSIVSGHTIGLLLRRLTDHRLIGVVNLAEPVMGAFRSAYLGYYQDVETVGQGYMTEGVGLAIDHAFLDLDLHRLEANIQPQNARSLALARRLGFRHEGFSPRYLEVAGEWRDHDRWAILAEEWRRAPGPMIGPQ